MKTKILCLLLSILFVLALTACGDTPVVTTPPESTPVQTTPSRTENAGEFVVSGEKYAYKDKDVLLLNVENQTDKNYDVTAVVHYFDAEGYEIKTQKQTFVGWAAGYQNYFLFQPDITFETFTYDLDLKEVGGETCYSKYIVTEFAGLREIMGYPRELVMKGDYTQCPMLFTQYKVENKSTSELIASGRYVLIDKNGGIYTIIAFGQKYMPQTEDHHNDELYWTKTTEKLVWPEELTKDVKAIFVVTSVKPA